MNEQSDVVEKTRPTHPETIDGFTVEQLEEGCRQFVAQLEAAKWAFTPAERDETVPAIWVCQLLGKHKLKIYGFSKEEAEEEAGRIVASLNFCVGATTKSLSEYSALMLQMERDNFKYKLEAAKVQLEQLQRQRDQAMHLLRGGTLTDEEVRESGLGEGVLIEQRHDVFLLSKALTHANSLIGAQADENDKLVSDLNSKLAVLRQACEDKINTLCSAASDHVSFDQENMVAVCSSCQMELDDYNVGHKSNCLYEKIMSTMKELQAAINLTKGETK
jgi:hypothetical protein